MSDPRSDTTLARMRAEIGTLFRWNFRISAALLIAGLVVTIMRGEDFPTHVDSFDGIAAAITDGRTTAIVDLAILVMMATPLLAALIVTRGFFASGDRRYGMISIGVLAILVTSVAISLLK